MARTETDILREYARYIFHMRRQLHRSRFGLIFGAGLSKAWNIPDWKLLNESIANDPAVDAKNINDLSCSETLRTQRLFEHYKTKRYCHIPPEDQHTAHVDHTIRKEWRDIIHVHLYAKAPTTDNMNVIEDQHGYIKSFITILRNTQLTVNYNFDDFIERLLVHHREGSEKERTKGVESAWDMRFPFRSDKRIIYHPNGFLPQNSMEASAEIVLSEDEFAEQLLGAMTGQNASLIHHLSRNTCLLIGLSLEDATLKHLLRQVARANPGQYHYYAYYYEDGRDLSEPEKTAISEANFETYNLITLFLCNAELCHIGKLIGEGCEDPENTDRNTRQKAEENNIDLQYVNYIVGAVGAGKSTCVMHFRNLIAYDEWFEPRTLKMGEIASSLRDEDREEVDKWILDQFRKKNHKLHEEPLGVFVVDRCPLDPISFTERDKWQEKAAKLLDSIAPGHHQQVVDGHVILLLGDPEIIELRLVMTPKKYKKDNLKKMQDDLKEIYQMEGVTLIDTRKMTLKEIIKRIARIIYLERYNPAKIHDRLLALSGRAGK